MLTDTEKEKKGLRLFQQYFNEIRTYSYSNLSCFDVIMKYFEGCTMKRKMRSLLQDEQPVNITSEMHN